MPWKTVWYFRQPAGPEGPVFIEHRTADGERFGIECKPATSILVLIVLLRARLTASLNDELPESAGWMTREQVQEAVTEERGYPLAIETISSYVSALKRDLRLAAQEIGSKMPPLVETRSHLGMRLADGVEIVELSTQSTPQSIHQSSS